MDSLIPNVGTFLSEPQKAEFSALEQAVLDFDDSFFKGGTYLNPIQWERTKKDSVLTRNSV